MRNLSDIQTVDHTTLSQLAQSGVIHEVSVVGQKQNWQIMIKYGQIERYLSAINSKQIRTFRKLETAIFYLEKLGIRQVIVNVIDNDLAINAYKRPDRTEAFKKMHTIAKSKSGINKGKKTD